MDSVDTVANSLDCPHNLGRLFLHPGLRGEGLCRMELVGGQILLRRLGFCGGFVNLGFHLPPYGEDKSDNGNQWADGS